LKSAQYARWGIRGASMHGDWVVGIATVLAAIIGVAGGYLLAKYQREKILGFVVLKPQLNQ
jgi:hypothetical protein